MHNFFVKSIVHAYIYRYQKIMLKCWEKDPNERPTFAQVVIEIEMLLSNSVGYLDLTL